MSLPRPTSLLSAALAVALAAAALSGALPGAWAQGAGGGAVRSGELFLYDSAIAAAERGGEKALARARAASGGLDFVIGVPAGWDAAWGGARTRFFPSDAGGPHSSQTFVEVNAVPPDEPPPESHLFEPGGLDRWIGATRPRFEVEDHRRARIGAAARSCEAILAKEPARTASPDRRELLVLVPLESRGAFLLRLSAPLPEFSGRDALWKRVLASFEPR